MFYLASLTLMFLSQGSHIKTWSLEQGLEPGLEQGFKLKTCRSVVTDAFEGQDVEVSTCETSLKVPYFIHFLRLQWSSFP